MLPLAAILGFGTHRDHFVQALQEGEFRSSNLEMQGL